MEIYAAIVTYNRLPLLKKCIHAILNQTRQVRKIVIYNNSTDNTNEYLTSLNDKRIYTINSKENVGGAGGFFYAIKKAYEMKADWIWVMDDDTIPKPDALEKLTTSIFFPSDEDGHPTGFLASRVDWIDGNRHLMNYIHPIFPWHHFHGIHENCYRILNCSFVSVLFNRKAIEKYGLPIKEFFIWGDDWEYTERISNEFKSYYISNSVAVHMTQVNSGTDYIEVNKENIWKYKYCARNNAAIRIRSFLTFIELIISLLRDTKRMRENNVKLKYVLIIWIYSFKGLFFNYKKYIQFPKV